jgi:hypothetical protein
MVGSGWLLDCTVVGGAVLFDCIVGERTGTVVLGECTVFVVLVLAGEGCEVGEGA